MKTKIVSFFCLMFVLVSAGCSSLAQAAVPEKVETAPEQVVEKFYADYLDYIGDPASDNFRNPLVDRMYADRHELTPAFVTQIDELLASFNGAGYDPFLCAQDIPEEISISGISVDGTTATVKVTTSFTDHSMEIDLVQVDGEWKINNIRCGS